MTSAQRILLGDTVAKARYHVTRESLVRYAGASGDFNSIHYRDDVAEAVGLPGVLAHGMLTLGLATQCVVDWLGDPAKVTGYRARFTKPVIVHPEAGADVDVVAKAAQVDEDAGTARIDLTVTFDGHSVLGKSQVWISLR
ncbi:MULTISPECIES: MaoC/PaaZ C-terminal domain-containing protein [unclassified Rhodococcus (in: high G+C Gram-positive bacteria)]|uniref:MaoC/PaaZ C-terminal domain-containing protein n=1 Tax=unclassified Rhodococcus (in: high G+C Gram-positive bacteria) TaxID=192944 RepID=UPI00163A0B3C|nr:MULTISPECIES: MaoC/PaaZ C-terminal domain-containing protein [unclassified Rhodococcus (in: high G+C Gram-positive bacteria)]MBC2638631.1 acyl dehydratase [Rhodococcus sp. 3A]MBC2896628.1 acyl dehydratase [Rhodococcus sp. 4CII]